MKDTTAELLFAAGRGDTKAVAELLAGHVSVNASNREGGTPLMSACAGYQPKMVEMLLRVGANVDLAAIDGRTALHAAVGSWAPLPEKQRECVRLLLDHGAKVDVQDNSGLTPLMLAAWFGSTLSVKEFLQAGALLTAINSQGQTARDLATQKYRKEIVRMLSEAEQSSS
jgi:ankyrin repeat protein